MADESPNPGLVEFIGDLVESTNRRDVHALVSHCAPDAVLDTSRWEMAEQAAARRAAAERAAAQRAAPPG
jgi:hypothetical protein